MTTVPFSSASPVPSASRDIERVVSAALALVGVTEQGGDNHGPQVEAYLKEVSLAPGQPWCAAFVYHVGRWALYDTECRRTSWPLPATGSCLSLGDFAMRCNVLVSTPARGDVFLLYMNQLARFAHTGIVVNVSETPNAYVCRTVEGNTNSDGSRQGTSVLLRTRTFPKPGPHRFVRWTQLTRDIA